MYLPDGFRLDRGDPDVWTLYGPDGTVAARFAGAPEEEEIEAVAAKIERLCWTEGDIGIKREG